ncbi:unnamed protein product [Ectocarpus sp. 4 AP-2014]
MHLFVDFIRDFGEGCSHSDRRHRRSGNSSCSSSKNLVRSVPAVLMEMEGARASPESNCTGSVILLAAIVRDEPIPAEHSTSYSLHLRVSYSMQDSADTNLLCRP